MRSGFKLAIQRELECCIPAFILQFLLEKGDSMTREEVFVIVKMQLIKWNPYGFSTTLSDEFDRESMAVAKLIHIDDSAEQMMLIKHGMLSNIFSAKVLMRLNHP